MYKLAIASSELQINDMLGLTIDGINVLLINYEGEIYAYEDKCAHLGIKLSMGYFEDDEVICAAHHWTFKVTSGEGVNPCGVNIQRFQVKIDADQIWVDLPTAPSTPTT
jgi:nitrite reductase/ring-hydroxylating ferredoxin subunit